ncbi:MAG: hypothetical protein M3159_02100 [Actinomycetota bacterium]|nr:hypothetical protein [Actinomycetota bacterium]
MDERVGTTITDWARVAAGFVVLGAQQAQVRRRELQKELEPHLREAAFLVGQAAGAVEERMRRLANDQRAETHITDR